MININKTPKRTSENYKINDYIIDENLLNRKITSFNNIKYENIKLKDIDENITVKYGLGEEVLSQINNNSNFKKEIEIDENGIITFTFDENNKELIDCLKINIKEDTKLLIKYKSDNKNEYYHNSLIKIILKENTKAKITLVNEINNKSVNLMMIDNELSKNSKLDFNIVDFGGNLSVSNYYSKLDDYSENNLNSIFLGTNESVLDINYIIESYGKKSKANINVEGVLDKKAQKNFKGTLDFKKGCIFSTGNESENTLLLSKDSRSKSLPMLLSSEENIEGTHSSSTGKVGKKELFYLTSRGISEKDAKKILVLAKFDKVLKKIENKVTLEEINKIIEEAI